MTLWVDLTCRAGYVSGFAAGTPGALSGHEDLYYPAVRPVR